LLLFASRPFHLNVLYWDRLFGLKVRLTDFQLRKVIYKSDYIENSNSVGCSVELRPGRYAVIPFTNRYVNDLKGALISSRSQVDFTLVIHCCSADYVLCCSYVAGSVEFELEDLLSQRY
jgi:hypothetical protein